MPLNRMSESGMSSKDAVFVDDTVSASTSFPISIPQRRSTPSTSQRHTNFTPPREYLSPVSVRRGSMTNFCSSGSVPVRLSLLVLDSEMEKIEDYPEGLRFTFSEPGFTKQREQQIGRELRTISDCFHMESGGFEHGYNFDDLCVPNRLHHRLYSSSFPGSNNRHISNWQYSIKHFPLQNKDQQKK